jgi:hypothetical protein
MSALKRYKTLFSTYFWYSYARGKSKYILQYYISKYMEMAVCG